MAVEWLPLESNPDAMNKFLESLGVPPSVQCVDVFGLDGESLGLLPPPVRALLFVGPEGVIADAATRAAYDALAGAPVPDDLFFMRQHISNACGTFALFHALANNADKIDIGSGAFRAFYERARGVAPDERSAALASDAAVAALHVGCADAGDTDARPARVEHHFICLLPKNGHLYEFDSRAPVPRSLAEVSEEKWLEAAGVECAKRMAASGNDPRVSAIALVGGA